MRIKQPFLFTVFFIFSIAQVHDAQAHNFLADSLSTIADKDYAGSEIIYHHFDKAEWKASVKDMEYKNPGKKTPKNADLLPSYLEWLPKIAKVFFYGFVILVIGTLVYWLVKQTINARRSRPEKTDSVLLPETDNPLTPDLEALLNQKLANRAFNEALRIKYLLLLKTLVQLALIHWRKEFTNRQYLYQLNGTQYQDGFRQITMVFEQVWYGKTPVNETEYQQFAEQCDSLVGFKPLNTTHANG